MQALITDSKQCRTCGQTKPLVEFSRGHGYKDSHRWQCRACVALRSRRHYERQHPEGRKRRPYPRPLTQSDWLAVMAKGSLKCRACGQEKPLASFERHFIRGRQYYQRACKQCRRQEVNREKALVRQKRYVCQRHGITPEQFDRIVCWQGECCGVCGRPFGTERKVIDHDHGTGEVRGIIHSYCNLMLGYARDNVMSLAGGIGYLLRHIKRKKDKTPEEALLARVHRMEICP